MKTFVMFVAIVALSIALPVLHAQEIRKSPTDSTMIFGTIDKSAQPTQLTPPRSSWGIDLLMSPDGFGLGSFYRHEYSDDLSGFLDFSISEAKDDNEKQFIDYYGQTFTPGKINRFLVLPLLAGVQKRLFKDDIVDNFRPYVTAAAGPTMIYVFPYNMEYFNALGKGSPRYTFGGYVGVGAFFGSERSNIFGLNVRYYLIQYPRGLASLENMPPKKDFGGFFITMSFGSAW